MSGITRAFIPPSFAFSVLDSTLNFLIRMPFSLCHGLSISCYKDNRLLTYVNVKKIKILYIVILMSKLRNGLLETYGWVIIDDSDLDGFEQLLYSAAIK